MDHFKLITATGALILVDGHAGYLLFLAEFLNVKEKKNPYFPFFLKP
jgi:hypothetical protein